MPLRISTFIKNVTDNISTKPKAFGVAQSDITRLEPWYVKKDHDGKYTVTVPSDLESFAEDPAVVAALAALTRLKADTFIGLPMGDNKELWDRCHLDTDLFYYGIAAALREGTTIAFPNYSGWFGKGYNLCVRRRLTQGGLKPWCIRGTSIALRNVFAHKAWGATLARGYKHLELLIREASDHIKLNEGMASTWVVPESTIRGTKIKKFRLKTGFLLQPDIDAINHRLQDPITRYNNILAGLSKITFAEACNLEVTITEANKAIRGVDRLARHISDSRAKVLFPPVSGKKKQKKIPIEGKLLTIDPVLFINKFGPYEACGVQPYSTSEEVAINNEGILKVTQLTKEFDDYVVSVDIEYRGYLLSWWNTEFLPRFA
jgi:hypothetical protein